MSGWSSLLHVLPRASLPPGNLPGFLPCNGAGGAPAFLGLGLGCCVFIYNLDPFMSLLAHFCSCRYLRGQDGLLDA